MTVSTPFSAPAWPPETGPSTNLKPAFFAAASSSRATSADAVVWSTKVAPFFMPAKAPSGPMVTARKSLSLPTQHITKSWPSAAALGVAAVLPPNFSAHCFALAAVRLYTVTSWPPFFTRCPAMGKPMTPRPRNATLAISANLLVLRRRKQGRRGIGGVCTIPPAQERATASFGDGEGICARKGPSNELHKKGSVSHGYERRRARPFQHQDPGSGRDRQFL